MSISQSTISRIIFRVSTLLAAQMYEVIKMPTTEEAQAENRRLFRLLGAGADRIGLPGVDGAIDCTHIRLSHTRFQELQEVYRNRKGYFSLNVQVRRQCQNMKRSGNSIHKTHSCNYFFYVSRQSLDHVWNFWISCQNGLGVSTTAESSKIQEFTCGILRDN